MKQGRKKAEKGEAASRRPEPEGVDSKKAGSDDSGIFRASSEMIGGNPNGIDGIRALQMIAVGFIILELGWLILRNTLHII